METVFGVPIQDTFTRMGAALVIASLIAVAVVAFGEIFWSLLRNEPPRR